MSPIADDPVAAPTRRKESALPPPTLRRALDTDDTGRSRIDLAQTIY